MVKALCDLDVDNCAVVQTEWGGSEHEVLNTPAQSAKSLGDSTDWRDEIQIVHDFLVADARDQGLVWSTVAPPFDANFRLC